MITTNAENHHMSLEEFRAEFNRIVSSEESYGDKFKKLLDYLTQNRLRLPLFYENNVVQEVHKNKFVEREQLADFEYVMEWNGKYFIKTSEFELQQLYITADKMIGYTWLFRNDRSEGKPYLDKLAKILLNTPERLLEFFAVKIEDYFECGDGNHRIYAAFLLNRPIKIDCYEEMTEIKLTLK